MCVCRRIFLAGVSLARRERGSGLLRIRPDSIVAAMRVSMCVCTRAHERVGECVFQTAFESRVEGHVRACACVCACVRVCVRVCMRVGA